MGTQTKVNTAAEGQMRRRGGGSCPSFYVEHLRIGIVVGITIGGGCHHGDL
jgi:hypothetical protein